MNYVVLARKYRPRRFEDMVGQDATVRALGNALTQQRLHHAYLFTGTRGIGKTTVSRIFAKCLNCTGVDGTGGVTATPCGQCDACRQIDEDRFIDYVEMDAASNRGIGEVRDLLERAAYKPSVGRFKVFMIDEAHQLTKDAFNALLKTLEEPPDYLKFVLATTDPQRMLPTVLSRCLQFNLRPMAPDTVREHLAKVLQAEGIEHDDESLRWLGQAAAGSMRDALSLTDQAIAYGGGCLTGSNVKTMLGSVGQDAVFELLDALSRRDAAAVVQGVDVLRDQGLSADGTLQGMAQVLQNMAIEQAVPGSLRQADTNDVAVLQRLAQTMPADDVQLLYSMVLHGRRELVFAPDAHAGLLMILLRLLAFPANDSGSPVSRPGLPNSGSKPLPGNVAAALPQAVRQPAAIAPAPSLTPAPALPAASAVPVEVATPLSSALGDRWAQAVRALVDTQAVQAFVRELAMQSQLIAVSDQAQPLKWYLQVQSPTLAAEAHVDKLSAALSEHLGQAVALQVDVGATHDTPAQREQARREQIAVQARARVQDDSALQAVMREFPQARIVPGSIEISPEFKP
jgi:DNA polymerase III subunit gamma/tau